MSLRRRLGEDLRKVLREGKVSRQLTPEHVAPMAQRIVAEAGAQGARDTSREMPRLLAETGGRADGRVASRVVQELPAKRQPHGVMARLNRVLPVFSRVAEVVSWR